MLYALCLSDGGSRATSLLNTSFEILRCSSTALQQRYGTTCITYRFWLLACDPLSLDPNRTEGRRNKTLLSVSPSSHFFFISTTSFELNSSHFNSTSISSPSGLSVRSIHPLEPGGFDRADLLAGTSKRLLLRTRIARQLVLSNLVASPASGQQSHFLQRQKRIWIPGTL
jgi:hypothetical protein